MAEIIQLQEFQQARRRTERRNDEHRSLEHALALMRENLAEAANDLRDVPSSEQSEILDRIEHLTAMIRYGMRMLSETANPEPPPAADRNR